jgi:16S rRNA (cytosine967-C5)-methyltransferase
LAALTAVEVDGAWSNLAVPAAVGKLATDQDRSFASHLAYDTLRWEGTLDWALGEVLSRPLADVEAAIRRVLRLGAVQLLRTSVPHRAAVDTSVSLAREQVPAARSKGAGGFVNGVLRALSRRVDDLPWPDPDADPVGNLVLTTAHPRWVAAELYGRLGMTRAESILAADNTPPGLTLRATGDRDMLVEELRQAGVEAEPGITGSAVRARGADPRRMAAVAEGRAVPQDEASMRVVEAAGVQPGARILDLCAGPGGKATHLAALAGPDGHVVAIEQHPHRARLIEAAASRQSVDIEVRVGDATVPLGDPDGFDVVLLDAPCSGLGTGRRRPEVRWRRAPADVTALAALQRRLLDAAVTSVRPGGVLVYAVCTWAGAETEEIARWFDGAYGTMVTDVSRRQLWPDTDDTDGMYIAVWQRASVAADVDTT